VPGYVEDELRGYLECGILCFGFARAVCMTCRTGFVVAFSCKGRGVCPSCNGRHLAQTAAHLADHVIPPPRKHRHRYHGVFAPNHKLRRAVTALAIGNIGKPRDPGAGGHAGKAHATGCCDTHAKPRSHDTSRIAWAKLMARLGEEFPLECPVCGGDIRLIAFITEPGPIRKILPHLGEPLEPPPVSPARGPPTDWAELVQVHF
jgi:hypothetical protein